MNSRLASWKKALYEFNRGVRGPLKSAATWPGRFQTAQPVTRIVILSAATVFLIWKFYLFAAQWVVPTLIKAPELSRFDQVYCLIHIDILLLIIAAAAVLFVFASGLIKLPSFAIGRPMAVFFAVACGLIMLFSPIPTLIANLFNAYEIAGPRTWKNFFPHRLYLVEAARLSLCLAFFAADKAAMRNPVRWWTLPFLIPTPLFNSLPLLWISFFTGWLPSKYWRVWRPLAAISACLLPILVYLPAQPIRSGMPVYSQGWTKPVCPEYGPGASGYEAVSIDGDRQLLIRIGDAVNRAVRAADGSWQCAGKLTVPGVWNQMGVDRAAGEAFIFDVAGPALYTLSLAPLGIVDKTEIPFREFPVRTAEPVKLAYDGAARRLVIMTEDNIGAIIDVDKKTVVADALFESNRGPARQILIRPEKDEIYILRDRGIYVSTLSNLAPIRHVDFGRVAAGMAFGENGLWISFPLDMEVACFNPETFAAESVINAPLGVRCLAVDKSRNLLFMASLSGAVEIRDLHDNRLIKRARVLPWIHWLTVLPETGRLVVTGGGVSSVVWDYLDDAPKADPAGYIFEILEPLLKTALNKTPIAGVPAANFGIGREEYLHGDARILVIESDETERNHAVIILQKAGYDASAAASVAEGLEELKRSAAKTDLVIVGWNLIEKYDEARLSELFYKTPVVNSAFIDEVPVVDNSPQTDIIKPFRWRETLFPVYKALADNPG